ncbi:unnamed protein product [Clonostachys solani]|uniref:Uncharacterized protein n=1 Tax=Clonostachys solani TaxID=160281 RepID=A0A9P0EQA0_9HYPO|nr:unnamed protein product [Clonostachys solani]
MNNINKVAQKSDQAPKDSANKYDKASLADLVNAVSKKTGKDPSKLENVHIKDIIEKDTEDRIKEVKKGRENEETVLYPNQESKDFEKIHGSEWGKSVQRIVTSKV